MCSTIKRKQVGFEGIVACFSPQDSSLVSPHNSRDKTVMKPAEVSIELQGGFAIVRTSDSGCANFIASLLETKPMTFGVIEGQVAGRQSVAEFFQRQDDGRLLIASGSVPRIAEALRTRQMQVEVRDNRPVPPRTIPRNSENQSMWQSRLTDAIVRLRGGVVVAPDERMRLQAVSAICRHFCDARCMLPFATVSNRQAFAVSLERVLPGQVGLARRGTWNSDKRVVCSTLRSFDTADPADWDIVIFPHAEDGLTKMGWTARAALGEQFVIAVVRNPYRLSEYERLCLELLAGPVICELGAGESWRMPVDVFGVFAPITSGPSPSDRLERKRETIWDNAAQECRDPGCRDWARGRAARSAVASWPLHRRTKRRKAREPGATRRRAGGIHGAR